MKKLSDIDKVDQRLLVLVLGSQKAGTSWMWNFIGSIPGHRPGLVKEYHIFDSIYVPAFKQYRSGIMKGGRKAAQIDPSNQSIGQRRAVYRYNFLVNPRSYFDFMGGLLAGDNFALTCDASPTYMALPVEALERIKKQCELRGIIVKPILLMREPVDRWLSDIRFTMQRRPGYVYSVDSEKRFINLARGAANPYLDAVSDYKGAMDRVSEVFGEEALYLIYEEFFNQKDARAVCDFLGVSEVAGDWGEIRNQSKFANIKGKPTALDYLEERDRFRIQYESMIEHFGDERIRKAWGDLVPT